MTIMQHSNKPRVKLIVQRSRAHDANQIRCEQNMNDVYNITHTHAYEHNHTCICFNHVPSLVGVFDNLNAGNLSNCCYSCVVDHVTPFPSQKRKEQRQVRAQQQQREHAVLEHPLRQKLQVHTPLERELCKCRCHANRLCIVFLTCLPSSKLLHK
jgi:hypothetical protein